MKIAMWKFLSNAVFYTCVGSFIYRFFLPDAPASWYLHNYNIMMLVWTGISMVTLVLGAVGMLADDSIAIQMHPMLAKARGEVNFTLNRSITFALLLFLGVTAMSWVAFAMIIGHTALSEVLCLVCKVQFDEAARKNR